MTWHHPVMDRLILCSVKHGLIGTAVVSWCIWSVSKQLTKEHVAFKRLLAFVRLVAVEWWALPVSKASRPHQEASQVYLCLLCNVLTASASSADVLPPFAELELYT